MNATRKFSIPANQRQFIEDHLIKLNKRAYRFNLPDINWSWGAAFIKPNTEDLFLPLDISGALAISYEGWSFVALIHSLPTGENIFKSLIDGDNIPSEYRATGKICEHCKVNRYRKDTYLLYNQNSNNYIQVGSTCIKDFLGDNTPENILNRVHFVSDLYSFLEQSINSPAGEYEAFYIKKYLKYTSACITKYGWLSKSKAYEAGGKPTVSWVYEVLNNQAAIAITDADSLLAESTIEWAESLSDQEVQDSNYLYSIRAIVRSAMVNKITAAFAASIIPAYQKAMAEKSAIHSNHVGIINNRMLFELTLKNCVSYQGGYGTVYKYIFSDDASNIIFWNASSSQLLSIGKKYIVRGTVKAHTEYKGVKQTQINRCDVTLKN